jgi:hypothetical protein
MQTALKDEYAAVQGGSNRNASYIQSGEAGFEYRLEHRKS